MPVEIFKKNQQASGSFNNGEILENKPIGFPQDGGQLKPYSNLFYWAHAWTPDKKSTIGLHPHQGFEICSFVLKGNINHFDTKQNKWIPLKEGDVQIIRAGNGISHAEEIDDNSEILKNRILVYKKDTLPVLEYYKNLNKLHSIDGMQNVEDVSKDIQKVLT